MNMANNSSSLKKVEKFSDDRNTLCSRISSFEQIENEIKALKEEIANMILTLHDSSDRKIPEVCNAVKKESNSDS